MKTSTEDKIKGCCHEVKGAIKEEVGKVTSVHVAPVLCAGERDVEHPQRFGHAFLASQAVVVIQQRSLVPEIEGESIVGRRIVKQYFAAVLRVASLPQERAKNDRIFQTLAFVNGREQHCVIVAFEAQLILVNRLSIVATMLPEPCA